MRDNLRCEMLGLRDLPPVACCLVGQGRHGQGDWWENALCVCTRSERYIRAWAEGRLNAPMTAEQRTWCLDEIDEAEGYRRSDHEHDPDDILARTTLDAWLDYCRDKGLL